MAQFKNRDTFTAMIPDAWISEGARSEYAESERDADGAELQIKHKAYDVFLKYVDGDGRFLLGQTIQYEAEKVDTAIVDGLSCTVADIMAGEFAHMIACGASGGEAFASAIRVADLAQAAWDHYMTRVMGEPDEWFD